VVEVLGSAEDKCEWLSRRLGHLTSLGSVLVFVSTKLAAEELARRLAKHARARCAAGAALLETVTFYLYIDRVFLYTCESE